MCKNVMMNKEIFDKYFKKDFISLIKDKVAVVRVQMAKTISHHFLVELNGTYVDDQDFNDAVRILQKDRSNDVRLLVRDIIPKTSVPQTKSATSE